MYGPERGILTLNPAPGDWLAARHSVQWKIMLSENEIKRIYWACRRGMLELDLVMVPFFEQRFRQLDERDQQRFVNLLESEDTDLFQWFLGAATPDDPELASIVNDINAFTRAAKA